MLQLLKQAVDYQASLDPPFRGTRRVKAPLDERRCKNGLFGQPAG